LEPRVRTTRSYEVEYGLQALMELQYPMLHKLGNTNVNNETLARYGLALSLELAEFLNETPRKSWRRPEDGPESRERMLSGFVDFLSYLGSWLNFLAMLGIPPLEISKAYDQRLKENNRRFGVTT